MLRAHGHGFIKKGMCRMPRGYASGVIISQPGQTREHARRSQWNLWKPYKHPGTQRRPFNAREPIKDRRKNGNPG